MPVDFPTFLDDPRVLREAELGRRPLVDPPLYRPSPFPAENTMEHRTAVVLEKNLVRALSGGVIDDGLGREVSRAYRILQGGRNHHTHAELWFISGGVLWSMETSGYSSLVLARPPQVHTTFEQSSFSPHHDFGYYLSYRKVSEPPSNGHFQPGPFRLPQLEISVQFHEDRQAALGINAQISRLGQALRAPGARRF